MWSPKQNVIPVLTSTNIMWTPEEENIWVNKTMLSAGYFTYYNKITTIHLRKQLFQLFSLGRVNG